MGNTKAEEASPDDLTGRPDDDKSSSRQDDASSNQQDRESSSRQWPDLSPLRVGGGGSKEQIDPYLHPSTAKEFEQVWVQLRSETGEKVTRSELAEAALILAFREYEDQGEGGLLYRQVMELRS